jgi:negative regulator of flagellin synthesis FlgM
MKIDDINQVNQVGGVSPKGRVNRQAPAKAAEKSGDRATVSGDAQIMAKAMENLKDMPDVREAKLEEIRAQILSGQYKIRHEELAKLLSSSSYLG